MSTQVGTGGMMILTVPQTGKMHQVSSQGRQAPMALMARAIGPGAPGKSVVVAPGETFTLAEIEGAGTIVRIWMTTMQPIPRAIANFSHAIVLRFYWDGEAAPSVEVPFGPFFGVPWGRYTHYVAQPLSCTSGGYNVRFPMPFARGCRIEVTNEAATACPALFYQVQYVALEEQPAPLRFHAQWRRENPTCDRIPFRESLVVDLDHGYTNQVAGDYASVAYGARPSPTRPSRCCRASRSGSPPQLRRTAPSSRSSRARSGCPRRSWA